MESGQLIGKSKLRQFCSERLDKNGGSLSNSLDEIRELKRKRSLPLALWENPSCS